MFRIGEFSKIAQVSGRLLRYYDQIGLFTPVRIDPETGYRYYSAKQLPELNRILALKELGLTLDQIARLVAGHISTDDIRGMLVLKKAQIEQSLREELTRIRYIESRIQEIDQAGELREHEVVVKAVPAQKLIAVRATSASLAECRTIARELGVALPARVGSKTLGHFAMIFHSELWDSDLLDVDLGFLLSGDLDTDLALSNGMMLHVQALPAVDLMATHIYSGIPQAGHQGYAALGLWAEANGYQFLSPALTPSREIFLQVPRTPGEEEVVAEIQIPVRKDSIS
jgi:DNA-binding transcriptional MerR regulator